ncbi:Ni/Fe hydrogenase subunit alpha [Dactylosporangium matsuzakiense]|uniref:NADP oxidoreductase n=1 Tax=Dactylosporangium matsuzakiense TaxID=53360 RepID=A0A9W6KQJ3_9ACTN|nr:Ni/Fe hydrogenase subunit alpha [Dactylosporangium matsuzakiense]GLL04626.1 NADP oxidoreductase [Dactylosporangium matsuzakiense]
MADKTAAGRITIDPVTRIEGHSKITIFLNDRGEVADAQFHVTQFRGFEKFCEGRPVHEMPSLMARICGICPVSHLVASAKAVDGIMAVTPPPAGADLRRLMNLAQLLQSHALSFFHLSSPDLLFGFEADPADRHLYGVLREYPTFARDGIALRRFGQHVIELLGGKRIHPSWIVPGGVSSPLPIAVRDEILAGVPDATERVARTLDWYRQTMLRWEDEAAFSANFPTAFLGLVTEDGAVEHYDGVLRALGPDGSVIHDEIAPERFGDCIGEAVEPWSYLKSTYLTALGYPEGIYRVGPLARVNVADHFGTPRADQELGLLRQRLGRYPGSSFHFHYARLVETLYALERIDQLLRDPGIMATRVRSQAGINSNEGIGIAEAPRGTLMHHYVVDDDGLVQQANLVIATGQNNLAMNRGVRQVAQQYVKADRLTEGMLNRVEAVIRCFDPCLSCSTHAVGQMPLHIQLLDSTGVVLDEVTRS